MIEWNVFEKHREAEDWDAIRSHARELGEAIIPEIVEAVVNASDSYTSMVRVVVSGVVLAEFRGEDLKRDRLVEAKLLKTLMPELRPSEKELSIPCRTGISECLMQLRCSSMASTTTIGMFHGLGGLHRCWKASGRARVEFSQNLTPVEWLDTLSREDISRILRDKYLLEKLFFNGFNQLAGLHAHYVNKHEYSEVVDFSHDWLCFAFTLALAHSKFPFTASIQGLGDWPSRRPDGDRIVLKQSRYKQLIQTKHRF